MKSSTIIAATVLVGTAIAGPVEKIGCYQASSGVTLKDSSIYNSIGHCNKLCPASAAFALSAAQKCLCGDQIPADADKVDDSKCNLSCPGYPDDNCGGAKYFMFYDNGVATNIPKADAADSASSAGSSASTTTSARPSVVTAPGQTVVVTQSSKPSSESSSGGPSKAGIAAGVVIGVVAIAGIVGGLFVFMRNRKRRAIEEEHARNAAINNFTKPTSSGATSFTDTRLDPVMAQRRMSDGSIADNQDYSRRILKVTNA